MKTETKATDLKGKGPMRPSPAPILAQSSCRENVSSTSHIRISPVNQQLQPQRDTDAGKITDTDSYSVFPSEDDAFLAAVGEIESGVGGPLDHDEGPNEYDDGVGGPLEYNITTDVAAASAAGDGPQSTLTRNVGASSHHAQSRSTPQLETQRRPQVQHQPRVASGVPSEIPHTESLAATRSENVSTGQRTIGSTNHQRFSTGAAKPIRGRSANVNIQSVRSTVDVAKATDVASASLAPSKREASFSFTTGAVC
jgi:hypothetical protein